MYEVYLAHHGIKGQKWGVRRFQNADGSLTSAGMRRERKSIKKAGKAEIKQIRREDIRSSKGIIGKAKAVTGISSYSKRLRSAANTNEQLAKYTKSNRKVRALTARSYNQRSEANYQDKVSRMSRSDRVIERITQWQHMSVSVMRRNGKMSTMGKEAIRRALKMTVANAAINAALPAAMVVAPTVAVYNR